MFKATLRTQHELFKYKRLSTHWTHNTLNNSAVKPFESHLSAIGAFRPVRHGPTRRRTCPCSFLRQTLRQIQTCSPFGNYASQLFPRSPIQGQPCPGRLPGRHTCRQSQSRSPFGWRAVADQPDARQTNAIHINLLKHLCKCELQMKCRRIAWINGC
jgi:hypothetical protein